MKKILTILLVTIATQACGQSSTMPRNSLITIDSGTSGTMQMDSSGVLKTNRICVFTFKNGDFNTEGCDFSMPLREPKIMPISSNQFRIEFQQPFATIPTTGGRW